MSAPSNDEFRNALGFRILDASNLTFFQNAKKEAGGHSMKVLPLMDDEKKTITYATFQKHFKFAINAYACPNREDSTFAMLIVCLTKWCDIPSEFFQGGGMIPKCGLIAFPNNEHEASIRLWNSKQIGKRVIYELTVSSYKDAVPQPQEDKPSDYKRVIIKDE
jgi:hypothetical protein